MSKLHLVTEENSVPQEQKVQDVSVMIENVITRGNYFPNLSQIGLFSTRIKENIEAKYHDREVTDRAIIDEAFLLARTEFANHIPPSGLYRHTDDVIRNFKQ